VFKTRSYEDYNDYVEFQTKKTTDPKRIEKWTGEEWQQKIDGFTQEFRKLPQLFAPGKKVLCIGARTGQEVVALKEMGVEVVGIDLIPFPPHVEKGDMHDLHFEDSSFDVVFSNVFDHSIYPEKLCKEIERVLRPQGFAFLQFQINTRQDEFTEVILHDPNLDVVSLFNESFCLRSDFIEQNFAGMNYEIVMLKVPQIIELFNETGSIETVEVPKDHQDIWDDINENIQRQKAKDNGLSEKEADDILSRLSKRAYYLTTIAKKFNVTNIAEVGTAQGWQYYNFAKYCESVDGKIWSCDIRDVRNSSYSEKYKQVANFSLGTSKELVADIKKSNETIDMFYIDGSHDQGAVMNDVLNLMEVQSTRDCVWVFDDYDMRFGCYHDLTSITRQCQFFMVHSPGKTASNNPTHQLVVVGNFKK
tara:strand:+ start:765 stop:2018 length:1254 start_codon:yes stop_codon:yes gene_type:complete